MRNHEIKGWRKAAIGSLATLLSLSNPDGTTAEEEILSEVDSAKIVREDKAQSLISFNSQTDYLSKYIFYGLTYLEDPVVQQTITASYTNEDLPLNSINASGFFNYNIKAEELDEADLIVDTSATLGDNKDLTLFGGYALYTSPTEIFDTSHEIFGGLTLENVFLAPTLLVAHDFKEGSGTYLELSATYGRDLLKLGNSGSVGVAAKAALGYNDHYWREGSGFSHIETKLSMPIKIGDNATVEPSATYQHSLDRKDFDDHLFWGLRLNLEF